MAFFVPSQYVGNSTTVKILVPLLAHKVLIRIGPMNITTFKQELVERNYKPNRPESNRFITDAGDNISPLATP